MSLLRPRCPATKKVLSLQSVLYTDNQLGGQYNRNVPRREDRFRASAISWVLVWRGFVWEPTLVNFTHKDFRLSPGTCESSPTRSAYPTSPLGSAAKNGPSAARVWDFRSYISNEDEWTHFRKTRGRKFRVLSFAGLSSKT